MNIFDTFKVSILPTGDVAIDAWDGHYSGPAGEIRGFAQQLLQRAAEAEEVVRHLSYAEREKTAPPVDRTQRVLANGEPIIGEDYKTVLPGGQQKGYVVLTAEERRKGFVRPVRKSYQHKTCRKVTTMGDAIAETYARDPGFYQATFCATCGAHFPLAEFTWAGTSEVLGS